MSLLRVPAALTVPFLPLERGRSADLYFAVCSGQSYGSGGFGSTLKYSRSRISEVYLSSQYSRGDSPGTFRSALLMSCWVLLHHDKVGAKRRQSNDKMLIESFIVASSET